MDEEKKYLLAVIQLQENIMIKKKFRSVSSFAHLFQNTKIKIGRAPLLKVVVFFNSVRILQ